MIKKKRIRKLNPYKNLLPATNGAYIALQGATEKQLERAGFDTKATDGTTILPRAVGRISLYNAEGKNHVRRDKPMETAYRVVEWTWTQWDGTENSKLCDVSYKRYPREFMAPPSIELTLSKNTEGETVVLSSLIGDWRNDEDILIHTINLFLELFGECVIIDEEKTAVMPANIHRVNWKLLPEGEYPFERVKRELQPVLDRIKKGKRSFVDKRLERLSSFKPANIVIGQSGFSGYVVMAYPERNLYVLESLVYGNATYALDHDWQYVSQLSKAEILSNNLHKSRVIHQTSWFAKVKDMFEQYPVK